MFLKRFPLMKEDGEGSGGGGGDASGDAGAGTGDKADQGGQDGTKGDHSGKGDQGSGDGGTKGYWPEDWRTNIAGTDEKLLKQLERYQTPAEVAKGLRALQTRLSSGELRSTLPKDAKPEEVAKWRTENGIPAEFGKYEMPDGITIGENDKPSIDLYLQSMHGENATPAQVKAGIKTYFAIQEQAIAKQGENDIAHRDEVADTLRTEWGSEYRGNINSINAMLDTAPKGVKDKLLTARMADGRAVMNDPDMARWLSQTAREINPVGTVVPAGGDQMGAITDEMTKIEKLMGNRQSEYWKGPGAEKMQARYRELVTAREKRK